MKIKSIKLPGSERFACSRALIKQHFGDADECHAFLGALVKTFQFDSRCNKKPRLSGPVVASISLSRDRSSILQLYPVSVEDYSERAAGDFSSVVLPYLRSWLDKQIMEPQTGVLGVEELIVEWTAGKHQYHTVRFL